jgi:hypothetical protein
MNEPSSFNQTPTPTSRRPIATAALIVGGFVGIFIIAIGILWGIYYYRQWQGERAVAALDKYLQEQTDTAMRAAMADTYGGSTPQETLQLYIDAVEKGDYELASKYFIESKREAELASLQKSSKEDTANIIALLKEAQKNAGGWSEDRKGFVITDPILVDFILYPNNVWKLVEI